ncbi:MAG: hypothetical protein ABIQ43_09465 [Sphingomonas sp.]
MAGRGRVRNPVRRPRRWASAHYHIEVENRLAGEIPKDLTGHALPEIEKALSAA